MCIRELCHNLAKLKTFTLLYHIHLSTMLRYVYQVFGMKETVTDGYDISYPLSRK